MTAREVTPRFKEPPRPKCKRRRLTPKPLPPEERDRRAEVRSAVFARDGFRCLLGRVVEAGPCFGPLTFHHRRKAAQMSNGYTVANGATLCSSHNDRLESDADLAALGKRLGLVVTRSNPDQGEEPNAGLRASVESAEGQGAAHQEAGPRPAAES